MFTTVIRSDASPVTVRLTVAAETLPPCFPPARRRPDPAYRNAGR